MVIFGPKCPKCGSKNIGKIKASFGTQLRRFLWVAMILPLALFIRPKKPLLVCRDCGFSWEKR